MSTAMDNFNEVLDGLRKRGAVGISLSVADGATDADAIAVDVVKMLKFANRESTYTWEQMVFREPRLANM
jgi:hypothetical protein